MSGVSVSPGGQEAIVFGVIIGLLILRRGYNQYVGTPVVPGRLLAYAALYPLLFVLVVGLEDYPILPLWSLAVDVAAAAVGGAVALEYVGRRVTIYQQGGRWMYRLGLVVPVVYAALFVTRLALEVAIGLDPFAPAVAVSGTTAVILEVVDALYGFSTGLALGRNIGVYRVYQRKTAAGSGAPLPSEPS